MRFFFRNPAKRWFGLIFWRKTRLASRISVNLCEVFYDFYRNSGQTAAAGAIEDLKWLGVAERNDLDEAFWREAGAIKGTHRIPLADCFAIALTNRVSGTLLTSDHHEMDALAALGVCPISFIR